ncbi:MAG: hypothetical protein RL711_253, partial [Bacteroidota bacterium]
DYIGKSVNSLVSEKVVVQFQEQGGKEDNVWLLK